MDNRSAVHVFTLSGLQEARTSKSLYFGLTLSIYILIIVVNLTLIIIISAEKSLHEPMYIFLCTLCGKGLYGTAGFYPKFLMDLTSEIHVISYDFCLAQIFVIYTSVLWEISILTVMAYDRFVAICRPLQYHNVMNPLMVVNLLLLAMCFPLMWSVVLIVLTARLPICGSHIDKLYCDNWSVVKLSCVPTTKNNIIGIIVILTQASQAAFTLYSYWQIIRICLKSREGRTKFIQTCLPHLLTITNFIISTLFDVIYSRYRSSMISQNLYNFLTVEFLVVPPLFNPIVYGLSLHKVRSSMLKICVGQNKGVVIN
ncbi:olfactory receptor 4E1-like [Chanos chanos]|uniref:Olfactory receptor 4E1-like n=1 Tax=Chanos chanos TaxID=29144 RepID=A0A6J2VLB7_CHACN|nr:olfactory receptor 4E1-like [Chanos chanos]